MFNFPRCILILLFITICSKARFAPGTGSQGLKEVATRRELGPMPGSGPAWGTCTGACGMKSKHGECWCDSYCYSYGDCCYDYNHLCTDENPANTCQKFCGQQSPEGCWCDAYCTKFNDCCPDKWYYCSRRELGSTEDDQPTQRKLGEVSTRGDVKEFEKNDITATSNFPTSHPTDVPSSIPTESPTDAPNSNSPTESPTESPKSNTPTESPTDSPKSNTPTESPTDSPIVGTDIAYEEITFGVPQERVLDALHRRKHASDFIRGHIEVEYDVESRQHAAEMMREVQTEEEFSERRQLSWGSCVGNCNGPSDGSCWCDYWCITLDDCCDDFEFACPEYLPEDSTDPAVSAQNSCVDSCHGKSQKGNCWCDSLCEEMGDCCDDYSSVCGYDVSNKFSCKNVCGGYQGSHPNTCWCDSACTGLGDCCHDYSDYCTRRELGAENNDRSARRVLAKENKKGGARKLLKML